MLGWWSWTAFYMKITEGNTLTNALWLAQHLKPLGYDYFHFDLGYGYARNEYTTPNASQFPHGMWSASANWAPTWVSIPSATGRRRTLSGIISIASTGRTRCPR